MRFVFAAAVAAAAINNVRSAPPTPAETAKRIDDRLAAAWEAEKIRPAALADDATFVRRLYLDLVGRIPTVAEVREFLNDNASDKRAKLVARLTDSGAHHRHMAVFWRRTSIPQADTAQFANLADTMEDWLDAKLRDGASYDRLVRELMTAKRVRTGSDAPTVFLAASESKPENLAANTMRAFLGINLDCAQCHDHPFARWTRDQFWQTAAFFTRPVLSKLELEIPSTKKSVSPQLLSGPQPKWPDSLSDETGRGVLAEWVTAKDNPYFAKNAVNRIWADLFGTGLVEPLDDLSDENPASHPELLTELAKAFADSGYNLKFLTAAIVLSKAYQLSSGADGVVSPKVFARSAVRGMTGEQLFDSLRIAAGLPAVRGDLESADAIKERKRFADKFRVERTGTAQRSILQSLSLMNGKMTTELTSVEKTPSLRAAADAPFLDTAGKIEALFLAALGRKPAAEESAAMVKYVEKGGADGDVKKALADVFWALLNSAEFNTNH